MEDDHAWIHAAHAALVAGGALAPLGEDDAETRLWLDHELASLAENRFFAAVDPLSMTPEIRARWEPRATSEEPLSSPHGQRWYRAAFWLLDGADRVGTIALSTTSLSPGTVTVSSLYVLPSRRRRGLAARALAYAHAAVRVAGGAGLRVPAYWAWQPAVRTYLGLGLWVDNWRDSIVFVTRDDLPRFRVQADGDQARFLVQHGERFEPWIEAVRRGDHLGWTELASAAPVAARRTFAVALAVRGFPLVRSPEAAGEPEGLARQIGRFEAFDLHSGWEVRTPRIPGLSYPSWDAG